MGNTCLRLSIGVMVLLVGVGRASAVDKCDARVDKKSGHLLVSASGVGANPAWGADAAAVNVAFSDLTCFDVAKQTLTKCLLGAADTLAARTPPEGCMLYLTDDGDTVCKVFIEGCTPGARLRDASFTEPNDPRGLACANQGSAINTLTTMVSTLSSNLSVETAARQFADRFIDINVNTVTQLVFLGALSNADLTGKNMSGFNLSGANLGGANLSWADLINADLSYTNLSHANLSYANLIGVNLSYASLDYANLSWADLTNAYLSNADLNHADLSYTNLSSAILSYASLNYANLSWADLTNVDLTNAELWSVTWDNTICGDGTNSNDNAGTCCGHFPVGYLTVCVP